MSDFIQHHGIKGMRWGVRRTPEQLGRKSGSSSATKTEEVHKDYANAHSSKSVKKMSDNELRSRIARINLEKQYSQMQPSKVERGNKILKNAVSALGLAANASESIVKLGRNSQTIYKWYTDYKKKE